MGKWTIERLCDHPELMKTAARWFHEKWHVPLSAYEESIGECIAHPERVPQWYVAMEGGRLVGGLGVIANDFHRRPDLTPNICAVYVLPEWRGQGIARALMDYACARLREMGVADVYLITTHTEFYERCGWNFYGMVEEEDGNQVRMYHRTC